METQEKNIASQLRLSFNFDELKPSSASSKRQSSATDRFSERLSFDSDLPISDLSHSQISSSTIQNFQINKKIDVLQGCLLTNKSNVLVEKYSHTNQRAKKLLGSSFLKRKKNRLSENSCIIQKSKEMSYLGSKKRAQQELETINISSYDLLQINHFDRELYQQYLELYKQYQQHFEQSEANKKKIGEIKKSIEEESRQNLKLNKELEQLKALCEIGQAENRSKERKWVKSAQSQIGHLRG